MHTIRNAQTFANVLFTSSKQGANFSIDVCSLTHLCLFSISLPYYFFLTGQNSTIGFWYMNILTIQLSSTLLLCPYSK